MEKRNEFEVLVGMPEGQRPLEDLDIGMIIILKWILVK
jgi:hypothetical protein